jgi:hypothetical protein
MRALVLVVLCLSMPALARAKVRRVLAAAKEPAPAVQVVLPPEQQVERAERLFAALEYDQVLPLVRAVLSDPSLSLELKVRALAVEGSTLAITADVADAERPFRKLLRLKPDFELPPKSPPKILAAFRKVQAEEKTLAEELEATRLKQTIAKLKLLDEPPTVGKGGRPLKLSLRVFDPDGTVSSVKVPYRRAGAASWSVLALARDETGAWAGTIPGEVTASADDYALETYVVTNDAKGGALLTRGSERAPLKIDVAAGTPRKIRLPRAVFFSGLALTAASGVAAAVLGWQFSEEQGTFTNRYLPPIATGVAERTAAELMQDRQNGHTLATATNVMLGVTLGLAAISALFAVLVDWSD